MGTVLLTVAMLIASNIFMTFAWYGHLKDLKDKPWLVAALVSWGIALFEYLIQVPANRIGSSLLSLPQLKILQEVITLCVFVPFMLLYMKQQLRWDFLWAALCLCGAVYFVFAKAFRQALRNERGLEAIMVRPMGLTQAQRADVSVANKRTKTPLPP